MKYSLSLLLLIHTLSFAQPTDEMHVAVLQKNMTGKFTFAGFWLLGQLSPTRPDSVMANVSPGIDHCKRDLQLTFSKDHTGVYYTGQTVKGCKKLSEPFTWKIETVLSKNEKKDILTIAIDAFDTNRYEIKELTNEKLQLIGDFNLGGDTTTEGVLIMMKIKR